MSVPEAKLAAVQALIQKGQLAQAEAGALRLAQQFPRSPAAAGAVRLVSLCRQQFAKAVYWGQRQVELDPGDAQARADLARMHMYAGSGERAVDLLREVVASTPDDPHLAQMLCDTLVECKRFVEAEHAARAALVLHPHYAPLHMQLANALRDQGRAKDASDVLQGLLREAPGDADLASYLATSTNYEHPCDPARVLAAHVNFGRLLEMADFTPAFKHGPPGPEAARAARTRPLRVGLISSDLRRHSVASFVEPLLRGLDRAAMTPLLFFTMFHGDDVTTRLGALAQQAGGGLVNVGVMGPRALAAHLHEQRLDVLIELNGLTSHHRLEAMRLRPAPVQMTWCGYPATTGLRAIDYRIVDSITDPPPPHPSTGWMVERPLRLDPCFLCFQPPTGAPEVRPRGEAGAGGASDSPITFGSFNMILKINPGVLDAWAAVLAQVPGSRLLVKSLAFSDARVREEMTRALVERGVARERLDMRGPVKDPAGHLGAYHEVDIALDTFPYTGTTTTCEALYMGVPVVTLAPLASMHAHRVSASLLRAAGLPELIAESAEEYVSTSAALAGDGRRLAALRSGLRERLRASPLCDAPGFAERFARTVRGAWEAWAAGGAPA